MNNKIPKIIHYCWFGKGEKPPIVQKCMKSWEGHLSDYQIIEWNEDNFSIEANEYCRQAYEAKKYAFVSDYVRVYSLYHYGGIYLDTDVEVFKNFDDLLHHESFWGFEQENYIATSTIGSQREGKLIKSFLESYNDKFFLQADGSRNDLTNVAMITEMLVKLGLIRNGELQEIKEVGAFYPQTFFSPYDYINCRNFQTVNTYTKHHFYKSWLSPKARIKSKIKVAISKIIGGHNLVKLRKL